MNQKGFAPLLIVVLILAALVGGYLVYQNQPKPTPQPQPTTQPSSSPADETASWKTYTGHIYSFDYPSDWTVTGGSGNEFYDQVVDIINPTQTVKITLSPFQYPYSFGGPMDVKMNTVKITVEGKDYSATENIISNKEAYVDLKIQKNKEHHILFGTGYPAASSSLISLEDYNSSKDTILRIISTLKIKD